MQALRDAFSIEELFACEVAIRSTVAPPLMVEFMGVMLPAMTTGERTSMLGGMKAGAPPEIFEIFRAAAAAALPPTTTRSSPPGSVWSDAVRSRHPAGRGPRRPRRRPRRRRRRRAHGLRLPLGDGPAARSRAAAHALPGEPRRRPPARAAHRPRPPRRADARRRRHGPDPHRDERAGRALVPACPARPLPGHARSDQAAGDVERLFTLLDPSCTITQDDRLPWGGRHRGHDGFAAFGLALEGLHRLSRRAHGDVRGRRRRHPGRPHQRDRAGDGNAVRRAGGAPLDDPRRPRLSRCTSRSTPPR